MSATCERSKIAAAYGPPVAPKRARDRSISFNASSAKSGPTANASPKTTDFDQDYHALWKLNDVPRRAGQCRDTPLPDRNARRRASHARRLGVIRPDAWVALC
jgi:hypothetical protein